MANSLCLVYLMYSAFTELVQLPPSHNYDDNQSQEVLHVGHAADIGRCPALLVDLCVHLLIAQIRL